MIIKINIPIWVPIVNYRTMTKEKKILAVKGNKMYQYEWMKEEISEFYEAIYQKNNEEIFDEAIGIIRTYQYFYKSKRVTSLWNKVRNDVISLFPNRRLFLNEFSNWHNKQLLRNQAKDVVQEDLIKMAKFIW